MPGLNWVADIPVSMVTGLALKTWCIVAVEATETAHAKLATDPDLAPILSSVAERQRVRDLLAAHGEAGAPDDPQSCLDRLRGRADRDIADLWVS